MEQRQVIDATDPCPCGSGAEYRRCCLQRGPDAFGNRIQQQGVPIRLEGTRTEILSSFVSGRTRFRILWHQLFIFPQEQPFHQFLDYLVQLTFNREWFKRQEGVSIPEQHVILRWRAALLALVKTSSTTPDGGWVMTGPVTAYLCLAYDLYWLQLIHRLPKSLVRRLRDQKEFQGARYEVAVAATFARAGFEIELLDESVKGSKHCEFIAVHKRTRSTVHVEAKSRRRPGVLNEPGAFEAPTDIREDVFRLYTDAVLQAPADSQPYFIFIDANRPSDVPKNTPAYGPVRIETYPWMTEIRDKLNSKWGSSTQATPENAVCITNYGSHFGSDQGVAPIGVCALFPSPKPRAPISECSMTCPIVCCITL